MIHEGAFFGYFFTFLAPTVRIPLFKCAWHTKIWTHLYIHLALIVRMVLKKAWKTWLESGSTDCIIPKFHDFSSSLCFHLLTLFPLFSWANVQVLIFNDKFFLTHFLLPSWWIFVWEWIFSFIYVEFCSVTFVLINRKKIMVKLKTKRIRAYKKIIHRGIFYWYFRIKQSYFSFSIGSLLFEQIELFD